jgi:hypothetical protein
MLKISSSGPNEHENPRSTREGLGDDEVHGNRTLSTCQNASQGMLMEDRTMPISWQCFFSRSNSCPPPTLSIAVHSTMVCPVSRPDTVSDCLSASSNDTNDCTQQHEFQDHHASCAHTKGTQVWAHISTALTNAYSSQQ